MSANASVPSKLKEKIEEWKSWDKNKSTLDEIDRLIDENQHDKLAKILLKRLSFGTAGLRGRMGAGYNAMNDLVIVQTTQGLLRYLEETNPKLLQRNGVIIGYDGRHNSKRFAELSAAIFSHAEYPVHLFSDVVPTPFVAYGVTLFKCVAGVMVTASHNPKDDNGYKVYWSNGCQIVSPVDKGIQQKILENLEPWPNSWDTDILTESSLNYNPLFETFDSYLREVGSGVLDVHKEINAKANLKLTYTAMHGVGYNYVSKLLEGANLHIVPVQEQNKPDPEFPTVTYPNPEEGKSSLNLSFETADRIDSKVILANDPDADRLAVAEKDESSGNWRIFNGNEMGALLGWWALQNFLLKKPKQSLSNCYMIASTVSSKILKTIAKDEGFNFEETLTGFKWIGNRTWELLKEDKQVLFAYEEAIGFMCDSHVLDKDGVSAALHMATLASYLYYNKKTLAKQLDEIYDTYGYHVSDNSYYICYEQKTIKKIFERLRNFDGRPGTYPKGILGHKYKITNVRDLTTGYDSNQPDNKAKLPVSKSSQMITFSFENGLVATLRTSGTEPKIKYYTELCASPTETDRNRIHETLEKMVKALVSEFLEPEKNQLKPRPD